MKEKICCMENVSWVELMNQVITMDQEFRMTAMTLTFRTIISKHDVVKVWLSHKNSFMYHLTSTMYSIFKIPLFVSIVLF